MTPEKEELLLTLADHTDTMHLALEGASQNDRLIYLGHLAMCARIFKSISLDEPSNDVLKFVSLENSSFTLGTPNDERGAISKESWAIVERNLKEFLGNRADA